MTNKACSPLRSEGLSVRLVVCGLECMSRHVRMGPSADSKHHVDTGRQQGTALSDSLQTWKWTSKL